jgi:dihydrofolate reductase
VRRLILQMQSSVDGYVAAAAGRRWQVWDWSDEWTWDEALQSAFNATFRGVDCILLSRPMAEQGYLRHWAGVYERHRDDPRFAFARRIMEVDKVVFTTRGTQLRWERTQVAEGLLADAVTTLKRAAGLDLIAFGGAGFARALLGAGLVDELQLFINPTAVGDGTSIFAGARLPAHFRLVDAAPYACGIVVARYAPLIAPVTST